MDTYAKWLEREIARADKEYGNGFRAVSEFWRGYAEALTNALNEYNGPGETE